MKEKQEACTRSVHRVGPSELPLSCPARDERLWDAHPRVYLPLAEEGDLLCPYCSTRYILDRSLP